MASNLFGNQPPSEDGRSDFERGTATTAFFIPGLFPQAAGAKPKSVGDVYPGHDAFRAMLEELWQWVVSSNKIPFNGYFSETTNAKLKLATTATPKTITRETLSRFLAQAHFDLQHPQMTTTNAAWLDCAGVTATSLESAILQALTTPNQFDDHALAPKSRGDGFDYWQGIHWGHWYQDDYYDNAKNKYKGKRFDDEAWWEPPDKEVTQIPGDEDAPGVPRLYDYQPVTWVERKGDSRYGWNQSHHAAKYIWGWDPKTEGDKGGKMGVHLGFPFVIDKDYHFIVWITYFEFFFEGVNKAKTASLTYKGLAKSGNPKASTGIAGRGQWVIENWPTGKKTGRIRRKPKGP